MNKPITKERLYSLDVLRGFDMFWIIGGGSLIGAIAKSTDWNWMHTLALQMHHVKWEGFRFYDLIFPLFMFIVGVVIPYSILSKQEKGTPRKQLILKAARRFGILFLLGLVYNGVFQKGFSDARYVSILAQIGFAYFVTVLIVLFSGSQVKRLLWLIGILAGVAILQLFVPVPGFGAGVLTPEGHINGYIDRMLLPGKLMYGPDGPTSGQGIYDALGILSTVSSAGITLLGVFAGSILRLYTISGSRKAAILAGIGITLIIFSLIIAPFYPVIKNCWTSTYTLRTGGISFVLVAVFYLVIDVWGWKKWSLFFAVIGLNSITIYVSTRIVHYSYTSQYLFGWLANYAGDYGPVVILLGVIFIEWMLLYYLFRNRIFLKV
jgi:predicted acyltransferase